jgi:chromosome segregation ATPase
LKVWRDEYAKKTIHHLPANMPKELISAFEVLWQTALEQAENQLAEYKKTLENERENILQKELYAHKAIFEIKLKVEELSQQLNRELSNNQKLSVDLAIANERLLKQDEAFREQKNQYENRFKRLYEEKENTLQQNHFHQNEIKALHENLALQAEEHKRLLAQQHILQEQSEVRWVKLIDQARQETKEDRKKSEDNRHHFDEKFKKLEMNLTAMQNEIHKKDAQLNMSQEHLSQLKQEIKFIETEYIQSRAIIMRFEEKHKLKKVAASKKSKEALMEGE